MPTPTVVATLPFPAASAARKTHRNRIAFDDSTIDGPATLSLQDATPLSAPFVNDDATYEVLLEEASRLARRLGCQLRRRLLGGVGGGYRWVRGQRQIVLDVEAPAADRLAVLANALRGEPRLAWVEMSSELAEYLQPRRAA